MNKVTMLFTMSTNKNNTTENQVRVGGWSESWYIDKSPAETRLATIQLCIARANLLPAAAAIIGQRYQVVGGGSSTGGRVFPGGYSPRGDIPQMALLCTMAGTGVSNVRRFALRGIADLIVTEGEYAPGDIFRGNLDLFSRVLAEQQFRMRGRDLNVSTQTVVSIDNTGLVVTGAASGVAANQRVNFVRTRDIYRRPIKGNYLVDNVLGTTSFHVVGLAGRQTVGGFVRLVQPPVYPLMLGGSFAPGRIVPRKVGRPFNQYRGRQSKKV